MALYMFVVLLITIEMVFSNPSLSLDSLNRYKRRNFQSSFNDLLNNDVYRRNPMNENRFNSLLPTGRRGVVPKGILLWPKGVVIFDASVITDPKDRAIIDNAMKIMANDTAVTVDGKLIPCITFREKIPTDKDSMSFRYTVNGCYTNIMGYRPYGITTVYLQKPGCFNVGAIQHELMHVLGFDHEQKRSDRDDYVTVDLNKIDPSMLSQYQKYGQGTTVDLKTPYDINSILHYSSQYIKAKDGSVIKIYPRLSPIDILEVRTLYQCKG